jgi:hypothetical protein
MQYAHPLALARAREAPPPPKPHGLVRVPSLRPMAHETTSGWFELKRACDRTYFFRLNQNIEP